MNLSSPLTGVMRETDAAIFTALARTADGLTGRRLESIIGSTSRSAFLTALERLQRLGVVTRSDIGNSALYRLQRGHYLWRRLRAILEIPADLEREIAKLVTDAIPHATLAVFGSYARGEANEDSDVDLVLLTEGVEPAVKSALIDALVANVEGRVGNAAHVVDIESADLSRMVSDGDALVSSWLDDSRTLLGDDLRRLIRRQAVTS